MGKGIFGTAAGAATIGQPAFIHADNTAAPAQPNNYGDAPLYASDGATGGYGGPGACAGTWITAAPRDPTNDSTPRFNFESEDPAATFECAIDSAFAPCSGPGRSAAPFTALADGPHVFTVRARNQAGARDPTPASTAFTVDTVPPDTIIDYQPPPVGRDPWAAVEFHSEDVAGFECRLDAEPFDTCTSPWSLEGVGDGRHSVEVRATDEAGNVQPVPARASFSIDTRRPVLDVRAPRRSGVGRGWTSIRARCSEACRLSSSPAVLLYLHRTRVKLRIQGATTRRVEAGRWNSLRMRLGRAQRARVKRVMASGGRAIMVANLTATDRAGNRSIRAVRVLLRR
jgi:hypothetical protein